MFEYKLSVLITTYNLEKYLEETFESVLMQKTDFDYEIIVGDDGSTDGTIDIVKKYMDRYPGKISYYVMPREEGVKYNKQQRSGANRINILEKAKGEYCTFLDGDDYYTDPLKLQKQVDILDKQENKDCVVCAHNIFMDYGDGQGFLLTRAKVERKFTLGEYWKLTYICTHALLFRNIYKEHPPKGNVAIYFADNNITFWLLQYGKMYYFPDNMASYRQVQGSIWNSNGEMMRGVVNVMCYGIEVMEYPSAKKYSEIRHYPDFATVYKYRHKINKQDVSPYWDSVEDSRIDEALKYYKWKDAKGFEAIKMWCFLKKCCIGYYMAKAQRFFLKRMNKY